MFRASSFRWSAAMALAVLLGQAASCCCCLGGAVTPPVTPVPISTDLARQMRDRLNRIKTQEGPFEVEITDQELTSYVVSLLQSGAGEFPARDMRVRFSDGYVEIWATFIDITPTDVPVYVRGTVEVVNGDLSFVITAANAGPFPVPGAMRQSIARVFSDTLADFEFGLEFESIEIRTGTARLTGQVTDKVPDLPWGLQGTHPAA